MQDQAGVTLIQVEASALPEPHQQLQQRDDEGTGKHQQAPATGRQRLDPAQVVQRLAARTLIAAAHGATGTALAVEHQHHRQQQQTGQLRGTRQAEEAIPGLVDRRGEGVEVEHRHRTEIGQGFHQGQGDTGADSRTGHRQRHPPERLQRRMPKHPRRFHQAFALSQEGGACKQVNVGVEHQHQNDDHPTGGTYPRQAHRPEPFTQQGLHRPGKVQQADEDECQHIGRNGERQHQRPVQPAPPGEFAEAGKPGQADPQYGDADAYAQHQGQGVAEQAAHLGVEQV
ncbi:hypothetical protein D3C81_1377300 [compost metagenome]